MRYRRYRPLVWLVGLCVASMEWGLTGHGQATSVERSVMQAVDQVNLAFQHRDVKTYESLTTPDFVRVTSNGRIYGRGEWLKLVAAPGPERPSGKFDQLSVRVYGDGAVVTYRATPAQPGVTNYQTRVMGKQGAQWILALTQSTDTQAPAAPTGAEPAALPAWSASSPAEREALSVFQAIQKANGDRDVAAWERLSAPDHSIIGGNTRSLKILARQGGRWRQVLQQNSPIVMTKK